MKGENGPPPDGWVCTPRTCPFDHCDVCEATRRNEGYGVYPPIPESIQLGEN